jgi:hypothetical protein
MSTLRFAYWLRKVTVHDAKGAILCPDEGGHTAQGTHGPELALAPPIRAHAAGRQSTRQGAC